MGSAAHQGGSAPSIRLAWRASSWNDRAAGMKLTVPGSPTLRTAPGPQSRTPSPATPRSGALLRIWYPRRWQHQSHDCGLPTSVAPSTAPAARHTQPLESAAGSVMVEAYMGSASLVACAHFHIDAQAWRPYSPILCSVTHARCQSVAVLVEVQSRALGGAHGAPRLSIDRRNNPTTRRWRAPHRPHRLDPAAARHADTSRHRSMKRSMHPPPRQQTGPQMRLHQPLQLPRCHQQGRALFDRNNARSGVDLFCASRHQQRARRAKPHAAATRPKLGLQQRRPETPRGDSLPPLRPGPVFSTQ